VRVNYAASVAEVHRVFVALSAALGDEGRVWLDHHLHDVDSTVDRVAGTALVEVFVTSRAWAHRSVRRALADIDRNRDVIAGGDLHLKETKAMTTLGRSEMSTKDHFRASAS
jgi:hypothetical protein